MSPDSDLNPFQLTHRPGERLSAGQRRNHAFLTIRRVAKLALVQRALRMSDPSSPYR